MKTRILIAESNPHTRQNIAFLLHSTGYEILQVETGSECNRQVKGFQPKIILLSVSLTEVNYLQILWQIKTEPLSADISVILCGSPHSSFFIHIAESSVTVDGYIGTFYQSQGLLFQIALVTRRIETLDELRRVTEQLRLLLEEGDECVLFLSKDGRVVTFSQKA